MSFRILAMPFQESEMLYMQTDLCRIYPPEQCAYLFA